jgi:hypothetical protein
VIEPQRLLTYFNGVLQFGQGLGFWSPQSLTDAAAMVAVYKSVRRLMDPLCCNYYRLFEKPTAPNPPANLTGAHVGWMCVSRYHHHYCHALQL